ncbi:hypothetical protein [Bradyrhizobium centrosematis]|uniref:hypothetical protein n=1 Tax=Bradyrhizobium centrosematis TaxID=1300039 RepID=UPI00388DA239
MTDDLRHLEAVARRQAALTDEPRAKAALLEIAEEYRERTANLESAVNRCGSGSGAVNSRAK